MTKDRFELDARLGFLLGAFRDRIETEIVKNLDQLLAHKSPATAFDKAVARRAAPKKTPQEEGLSCRWTRLNLRPGRWPASRFSNWAS